jgi:DNA modification methylase
MTLARWVAEVKHPAPFSPNILDEIEKWVEPGWTVLDPFAGSGRIHWLRNNWTIGTEIEYEWAWLDPMTINANALYLPFRDKSFDAVVTSPTYGNRMADHHNAKDDSKRITYRHVLGRELHPENTGRMQWGDKYRTTNMAALKEMYRVCRTRLILNVSDHIRKGEQMPVVEWWCKAAEEVGFKPEALKPIATKRMRMGANSKARVAHEAIIGFSV